MKMILAAAVSAICLSSSIGQAQEDVVITQPLAESPASGKRDIDRAHLIEITLSTWGDEIVQRGGSPSQLAMTLSGVTDAQLLVIFEAQSLEELNDLLK